MGNFAFALDNATLALLVAALALIVALAKRGRAGAVASAEAPAPGTATEAGATASSAALSRVGGSDARLVAVIAAAVSAARADGGAETGRFRIASVEPTAVAATGFNTPAWGHVDRLGLAPGNR
jgi:Na+-transporting methylmalonyl-CoA/oxaloacetate decarboxylase gamma subunit